MVELMDWREFYRRIFSKRERLASKPLTARPPIIDFTPLTVQANLIQNAKFPLISDSQACLMGIARFRGKSGRGDFDRPGPMAVLLPIEFRRCGDAGSKAKNPRVVHPKGCV